MDCQNKTIIFGNHDYGQTGYYYLKFFLSPSPVYEVNDIVISTLSIACPGINEEEVGHRPNQFMETTLTKINNKLKIIVCIII